MKEEREQFGRDESGYSESSSALQAEINAGEWTRLVEFPSYRARTRQGKIIATYHAISNRLEQLVAMYYQLVNINPERATRLLAEIKKLRKLSNYLLDCLSWEKNGEKPQNVPQELKQLLS